MIICKGFHKQSVIQTGIGSDAVSENHKLVKELDKPMKTKF